MIKKTKKSHTRKIVKLGGLSYGITFPIDVAREWNWKEGQEVTLKIDEKKQRIIVSRESGKK